MRLIILHNTYQLRGGEDAVVAAEAALLRAAGHSVHVETVSNDRISGLAAKLRAFHSAPYKRACKRWVADLVGSTGAELVHIHNFFPLLTPAVHEGAAERGIAVVQTLHNYRLLCANALFLRNGHICQKCLQGSRVWGAAHRCYRGSLPASLAVVRMQWRAERHQTWHQHVHRFIALTEFARSKFVAGGLPAERIAVKPNFVPDPKFARRLREQRKGALFVGRLAEEKGVDVLIKAWKHLPDIPLTIVGDGPERARMQSEAPANVRLLGLRSAEEVRAQMAAAQCLVVPSIWYEPFGMVAIEAFAVGRPVIASRIGALAELVTDQVTGWHFTPGDPESLAEVMREAFGNHTRLAEMGRAARRAWQQYYSPAKNLAQLERIYKEALGESGHKLRDHGI